MCGQAHVDSLGPAAKCQKDVRQYSLWFRVRKSVLGRHGSATNRVALTSRPSHIPMPEALELELAFLEYRLK
jgi:hypothetical protein